MELIQIYKCLSDMQRLRILNLLKEGPLCVCHIQEILEEGQVKVSKQLSYMKKHGLLEAERDANWMIYSLVSPVHPVLLENLKCLRSSCCGSAVFKQDLEQRAQVLERVRCREDVPAGVSDEAVQRVCCC